MKKTVIIGGGIAGLSTGIFLQKQGVPTVIYEKNAQPGGLCLSSGENGFRFDLCCRYINGIKSGRRHKLMTESGALIPNLPVDSSEYEIYENEGEVFRIEWTISAFRKLLSQLCAPEDAGRIDNFFTVLEKFRNYAEEPKSPPFSLLPFRGKKEFLLRYRSYLIPLGKAVLTSTEKWIAQWSGESVRKLWRALYPDNYSLYAFYTYMAARLYGNSGYPRGGSAALIRRLTDSYLTFGGELITGVAVDEIIIDRHRVTGIRVAGKTVETDTVATACDVNTVLGKLLKGKVKIPGALRIIRQGDLFYPLMTVCYGIRKQYGLPATFFMEDEKGVDGSPDLTNYQIEIHSAEMTPDSAPAGKSALIVNLRCDYYFWKNLRQKSEEAYRQYALMVVDELNACLDRRFPGFTDSIETVKTFTPLDYEENTALYKGSWRGFAPTVFSLKNRMPRTAGNCRGLYFCGQSVAVGGGIDAVTEDAYDTALFIKAHSLR